MVRGKPRKREWGFYKQQTKVMYFSKVDADTVVEVERYARVTGLGQGTLTAKVIETVMKDQDLRRVVLHKIEQDPEVPELKKLAAQYAEREKLNKGAIDRFSKSRIKCGFCGQEMYEFFLPEHLAKICKKIPKLKALPDKRPLELVVATRV